MLTMQLQLNLDAQKFIQQVQVYNKEIEQQISDAIDVAFSELSNDGTIQKMLNEAVRKNIMDSFSRWVFQSDIRGNIEKQLTEKLSAKVDKYTDSIVKELAEKMNLPAE